MSLFRKVLLGTGAVIVLLGLVGFLLPGNVGVRTAGALTIVGAMDPAAAMGIVGNPAVESVANEAKERLEKALATL